MLLNSLLGLTLVFGIMFVVLLEIQLKLQEKKELLKAKIISRFCNISGAITCLSILAFALLNAGN